MRTLTSITGSTALEFQQLNVQDRAIIAADCRWRPAGLLVAQAVEAVGGRLPCDKAPARDQARFHPSPEETP